MAVEHEPMEQVRKSFRLSWYRSPIDPTRLKELTRLREALLDFFLGDNEFGSSEKSWRNYFYGFAYAAALEKGRRTSRS